MSSEILELIYEDFQQLPDNFIDSFSVKEFFGCRRCQRACTPTEHRCLLCLGAFHQSCLSEPASKSGFICQFCFDDRKLNQMGNNFKLFFIELARSNAAQAMNILNVAVLHGDNLKNYVKSSLFKLYTNMAISEN